MQRRPTTHLGHHPRLEREPPLFVLALAVQCVHSRQRRVAYLDRRLPLSAGCVGQSQQAQTRVSNSAYVLTCPEATPRPLIGMRHGAPPLKHIDCEDESSLTRQEKRPADSAP